MAVAALGGNLPKLPQELIKTSVQVEVSERNGLPVRIAQRIFIKCQSKPQCRPTESEPLGIGHENDPPLDRSHSVENQTVSLVILR